MAWIRRLLNVVRPRRLIHEIDRELEFHLAERADELMAAGMSEDEARREARRRFGNPTLQRERTRDADVLVWLDSVLADLRFALRGLRRSPGFALVAILSVGLGIGANTAIFSLIDAVILRSLPVAHPEELVQVFLKEDGDYLTNPLWEAIRDRQQALDGIFAAAGHDFDLAVGGEARRVVGDWVSGDFFGVLGVAPAVGRLLTPADDFRGCPAVAVLGYGFWQREYGGAADAVGRSISLDSHPFEIVGVAASGFSGITVGSAPQVYVPLCTEAIVSGDGSVLDHRSAWFLNVLGRPAPGLSPAQAGARLAALSREVFESTVPQSWKPEEQAEYRATTLDVRSVPTGLSDLRDRYRGALFTLMALVGVVLLIACGNVANLLLARATGRRRELAIRRAIGSGRSRLVRQLVTESLLLALLGAGVGVVFARWAGRLLIALLSSGPFTVWLDLSLDGRVLAFTVAVATATGLLFGLTPAWRSSRVAPQAAMRARGRGGGGGGRFRVGKTLVVAQLALSLAVVMGAGLLLGTFARLVTLDPGFHRDGVLMVTADLRYPESSEERMRAAEREILGRLRALPGVRSAGASLITPIGRKAWNERAAAEGFAPAERADATVWFNGVSDGYFTTLGIRLLAGRDFDDRDLAGSTKVAVVNEALARRFFGQRSPLGRTFRADRSSGPGPALEVVGVVEDSKYGRLDEESLALAYVPLSQSDWFGPEVSFALRAAGDPGVLPGAVEHEIAEVHPAISLDFTTLSAQVAASLARPRLLAALSGFFGAVALLLAMIGLYGTLSSAVASRRGEVGVRLALGATPVRVLRMVLGEVGWLVVAGLALGAATALASTRLLAAFLFGVTATDPWTLALSAATLAAVAFAAGALPAWRAACVDPMTTLRED